MRGLGEVVDYMATADLFPITGIPVLIFIIAATARIGVVIAQARPPLEAFHVGLEFCVLSLGIFWRASYSMYILGSPAGVFLLFTAVFALLLCIATRVSLAKHPKVDVPVAAVIGVGSLSSVFLAIELAS